MDSPTLNMVQNQIAPNGVTNDGVLEAFLAHDRANYVPSSLQARAYADDNIIADDGALVMLRPLALALMVQHLARQETRGQVAVIGDPTGYVSDVLHDLGFAAIDVADDAALDAGSPWHAIVINGAVEAIPAFLFPHLDAHGIVLTIQQKGAIGDIVAATTPAAKTVLGQASAPLLPAFVAKKEFAL